MLTYTKTELDEWRILSGRELFHFNRSHRNYEELVRSVIVGDLVEFFKMFYECE